MKKWLLCSLVTLIPLCACYSQNVKSNAGTQSSVVCLDGSMWKIAKDPQNVGRTQNWFRTLTVETKPTKVPWIIQDAFPDYHGVAWYWRDFQAPINENAQGRTLLRFWAVDYKAEVWLNSIRAGEHEGGESPFQFDVTDAIRPGASNLLSVRVLNPTHTPIDGIVLNETPHRNKALPYGAGSAWNQGGIMDSVELLLTPAVRISDLHVNPDWKTGEISVRVSLNNATATPLPCLVELSVAPAASGQTLKREIMDARVAPGESTVLMRLAINDPHLWDLNDPFLYRVTAGISCDAPKSRDEQSARFGFRDFRLENGWFQLNGRRLYLKASHTGNCTPIGLELPHDPDVLRRDLINAKAARFNCIRFISGVAKRHQLDLCDEIGLLVYEESYAGWCLADSPRMKARYDESVLGMVRRDRNHPSVVIWGLLNETPDGPVFRHAVSLLPEVRALDDSRVVILNSGRWDTPGGGLNGLETWREGALADPCITHNSTRNIISGLGIKWQPGQLAFHPGREGQFATVRWTSDGDTTIELRAVFESIAERATTDVHILHNSKNVFTGHINVQRGGSKTNYLSNLNVKKGDTVDFAVGFGNKDYGADTTSLSANIKTLNGKTYDAALDFSVKSNPNKLWSYGQIPGGSIPASDKFTLFRSGSIQKSIGSLSNPGSAEWEDSLNDTHPYQSVPHTASIIHFLRTTGEGGLPLFLSEYGIGSAVDLVRTARHYEQWDKELAMDAKFYRRQLDRFLEDWNRWNLQEAFARPEDFFKASQEHMAGQRLLGLNAIRANPNIIAHSLTGTVD